MLLSKHVDINGPYYKDSLRSIPKCRIGEGGQVFATFRATGSLR